MTREEIDLAIGPMTDGTCSCPSVLTVTSWYGSLVLYPAISICPAPVGNSPHTYARLQPIHARKRTWDADTPTDIRPPPYQSSFHDQIHRFAPGGSTRRECPVTGVIRSAENIVLRLAPHDALGQVGFCNHNGAEALKNLHNRRGDELGCVVDVTDIADGGVGSGDIELVFERYGEAMQRTALGWWKRVKFGCVRESTGEERFGESVYLG